ncbi:formylglycine-generating enzyme isoform X2 [Sitodiplosis mosellana]|uniref:formylglycine-generating enzyme isoform X2 n=1 Tax=Sitodiplosis mosellana TaxID=263140 RepID=UPI00244513CD|nr:formylglycine-generating enzyme isoform X2 [Sitodiplosis mosellana]
MFQIKCSVATFLLINYLCGIAGDCGCNKLSRSKYGKNAASFENEISSGSCAKSAKLSDDDMVKITGGNYIVGTNEPIFQSDRESPERTVSLNEFYIDKFEVSNAEFTEFVEATKYVTYAEKFGDSFVFQGQLSHETRNAYSKSRVVSAPWWYKINGTTWKHPEGVGSSIDDRRDHPVVHVSWIDANAFCEWKEKRLYPWGNKLNPGDKHWLNIWQGEFPDGNTADDGYLSTCPVDRFKQNDFDLYNMVGNVWEWTESKWNEDADETDSDTVERVKKGGSYLCHKSFCYRYRCAARSSNTADSSAGNLGFRCAKS